MIGSPVSLAPKWQDLLLLVLPCGPRGFLQRYQHLSASVFPPNLWRPVGFLPVMRAEGRYPCNGINPVYLFLFIIWKYEMFALYNHPPPDVAQRSSASTIPSVNPKRRCLRRQLNRPSGTRKQTRLKSWRVIPKTNLSLEGGRFGLAFIKRDFIFGNPCWFLTACGPNYILLYVCVYIAVHISTYTHSFSNESRKATDFYILSCLYLF